jgi:2-C-methyl-D-erythritol 2,4-cyclodiphosphate synthase
MSDASPGSRPPCAGLRIGHGYDAHRLEAGQGVTLGGVHIPCAYRLIAHSDGDVLIHALCDALLGACALGDIGKFFPDTDAQFKGIDSRQLLRDVMRRVSEAGYAVVNADMTLIAQVPKVAPHVDLMRTRLASDLGVLPAAVNVKATTNEGMGHIGRKEGIAGHAVVLLQSRAWPYSSL